MTLASLLSRPGVGGVRRLWKGPPGPLTNDFLGTARHLEAAGFAPALVGRRRPISSGTEAVVLELRDEDVEGEVLDAHGVRSHELPPRWLLAHLGQPAAVERLAGRLAITHRLSQVVQGSGRVWALFERVPSFPRTPYVHGSSVRAADDLLLTADETEALLARPVVVQEKVDGFNAGLWFHQGELLLCDMSGGLEGHEHRALLDLRLWAERRRAELFATLEHRFALYVEVVHLRQGIAYARLPDRVLGIDVLDREEGRFLSTERCLALQGPLDLHFAPVVSTGVAPRTWEALDALVGKSRFGAPRMEGVVVKAEAGGFVVARAKHVHRSFEPAEHPTMWARPSYNPLPRPPQARAPRGPRKATVRRAWLSDWSAHLAECDYPQAAVKALSEARWQRAYALGQGELTVGRAKGRALAVQTRTLGFEPLHAAAQAVQLWAPRGVSASLLAYDAQPPGPAEALALELFDDHLVPLAKLRDQPERLAGFLRALHVPLAQVRWVFERFPIEKRGPRGELASLLERASATLKPDELVELALECEALAASLPAPPSSWVLCVGDWSTCLVGVGPRRTELVGAERPSLGDGAADLARLCHLLEADMHLEGELLERYLEGLDDPSFVARVALHRRLLGLRARVGASPVDVVQKVVASQSLASSLPPASLLAGARRAVLAPARGRRPGEGLGGAPLLELSRRRGELRIDAFSSLGRRHTEAAWALAARERGGSDTPELPPLIVRWPERPSPFELTFELLGQSLLRFARAVKPHPTVLVASPEGTAIYLRQRFLEQAGFPNAALRRLYSEVARSRLEVGSDRMFFLEQDRLAELGVSAPLREELDRLIPTRARVDGPFWALSFAWPAPHTVVNYPWGRDAAYGLCRALLDEGVERLAFVGACGLFGTDGDTEDVVVPSALGASDGPRLQLAQDALAADLRRRLGEADARARLHVGPVFDVDSVLLESEALFLELRAQGYLAAEMECYGLAKASREAGIDFSCALFTTDVLARGKGYFFDEEARKAVLRRPVRAKHLCLDALYARLGLPFTALEVRRGGARRTRSRPGPPSTSPQRRRR